MNTMSSPCDCGGVGVGLNGSHYPMAYGCRRAPASCASPDSQADGVLRGGGWRCQSPSHTPGRYTDAMLFRCTKCKRVVCSECEGGTDAHPELCDFCWQYEARLAEAEPAICVAALVTDAQHRVLLVRHRRRGTWELPGGKKHPNETWAAAMVREVQEEAGLTIAGYVGSAIVAQSSTSISGATVILARAEADGAATPIAGDDAEAAEWFAVDAIPWDSMSAFPSTQYLREWRDREIAWAALWSARSAMSDLGGGSVGGEG
jgi:ADP-ribose pyrophosphatase YjhB (NUDIX family)